MDAFVRVKENQKRGLPHDHALFWLNERDKPTTPEQFDDIFSAEIPDQELI